MRRQSDIGDGGRSNVLSHIVRFLHEEEKEGYRAGAKDTGPVEYPSPALVLRNESTDDGGEKVAAGEEKRIQAHVRASLVREVLELSVFCIWSNNDIVLTTSVTVISGRASIGAVKKPEMTLRAIHWPLVFA